ncbi:MAG: hypothetical protein ACOC08_04405 [Campylobacterales bacterium]
MIREIIKPTGQEYTLHIPKEYLNQEVEILVLPFSHNNGTQVSKIRKETTLSNNELDALLSNIRETLHPDAKTKSYDELRLQALKERI